VSCYKWTREAQEFQILSNFGHTIHTPRGPGIDNVTLTFEARVVWYGVVLMRFINFGASLVPFRLLEEWGDWQQPMTFMPNFSRTFSASFSEVMTLCTSPVMKSRNPGSNTYSIKIFKKSFFQTTTSKLCPVLPQYSKIKVKTFL